MSYISHNAAVADVIHAHHTHCGIFPVPLTVLAQTESAVFNGQPVVRYEGYCPCGTLLIVERSLDQQGTSDA